MNRHLMSGFVWPQAAESTCLKRVTVCAIYDKAGSVLAVESNRCNPPNGVCARQGVSQGQDNYPTESSCQWEHAEVRAVRSLPVGAQPFSAALYGHDFPCKPCETALWDAGVQRIHVCPQGYGTGPRGLAHQETP